MPRRPKAVETTFFSPRGLRRFRSAYLTGRAKRTQVLKPRSQVNVTPLVKKFALKFRGSSLQTVKRIVNAISSFQMIDVGLSVAQKLYSQRTAHDIIHSRKIPTYTNFGGDPLLGCADMAIALSAVLKAKGINSMLYRFPLRGGGMHTQVIFELDGQRYLADPFPSARKKVKPLSESKFQAILASVERGRASVGRDLWSMGIKSFEDFLMFEGSGVRVPP